MGKTGAYITTPRISHSLRPVADRTRDYCELYRELDFEAQKVQASRCMMCGVAFCQYGAGFGKARPSGCPLHNLIPEWNDLLYRGRLREAADRLALTSPLPEFTSRVCPALCEAACNLGKDDDPECIHDNERAISDWEWAHGGPRRFAPAQADAPLVGVVGSGPAGLAIGWELARRGCRVKIVERADRPGGLLMYGIPNMKLEKDVVARRVALMQELGVEFVCSTDVADAAVAADLADSCDAVVIAAGARRPRGLGAVGFAEAMEAGSAVWAVEYLESATRFVLGDSAKPAIDAFGKHVVVIGGGDTGNDCMGTAVRQGAASVSQLEFLSAPPEARLETNLWPEWPNVKKTDYGQAEAIALAGGECRQWGVDTLEFCFDSAGTLTALEIVDLDWSAGSPQRIETSKRQIPADLVCIACGFTGPEPAVFEAFGVESQNTAAHLPKIAAAGAHRTVSSFKVPIYVAGDARSGSSLVVSAIADAMSCADEVMRELGECHG